MDVLVSGGIEVILVECGEMTVHTGLIKSTTHNTVNGKVVRSFFELMYGKISSYYVYAAGNAKLYKVPIHSSRNGISQFVLLVDDVKNVVKLKVEFTKDGYKPFVVERSIDCVTSKTKLFKDTKVDYSGFYIGTKAVDYSSGLKSKPKTVEMVGKDGEVWNIPAEWLNV